jgi:uncharacterized protein
MRVPWFSHACRQPFFSMSRHLDLAPGLSLPIDAVTQTIAILAKRRVGKSYAARRFAEQLFKAGQQIVIVDPKGDWWGIRSGADGKSPGLPVAILGGERGDVPLEVGSGEVVAKLAAEERVSMLLDLSLLSKRQLATFMTDFLEHLYRIKAREVFRTPLMLIVDEADAIAPQKPQDNEARMLGAAEDIVRRGGQRGLGCILVTQRSAVLNKNVLTQSEMIVALRTISPQDLKAMDAWIDVHGTREQRATLMSSLPSLPVGDAWFWSPGWPTERGIFQRVHVLPIETFDSGASPKPGEKRVEPKNVADIDLGALAKQMAATIEKAKANDPKELKKKIAQLEADLRKGHAAPATRTVEKLLPDTAAIERAVSRAVADVRKKMAADAAKVRGTLSRILRGTPIGEVPNLLDSAIAMLDIDLIESAKAPYSLPANGTERYPTPAPASRAVSARPIAEARPVEGLSRPQVRMLQALRGFETLGIDAMARSHVAVFSDQSPRSSGADNNFSALSSGGYIERLPESRVRLTELGRSAAGEVESPASLVELHEAWFAKVSGPQAKMLRELIERYGVHPIPRDELAKITGQSPLSSGYDNNLSALRSLGLIAYEPKGYVVATDLLFPEGLR